MICEANTEAMDKKLWSKKEIKKLIERYKENPILWDTRSVDYRDIVKKRMIQNKLSAEFNTTDVEIGRKMRILRAQWTKEYKNTKKYAEDFGHDYAYESRWMWFEPLKAIFGLNRNVREEHPKRSNELLSQRERCNEIKQSHDDTYLLIKEDSICADDLEYDEDGSEFNFTDKHSKIRGIDEFQIFGNYVANELRSMHYEKNIRELKRLIQKQIIQWSEDDDKEYYSNSSGQG